MATVKTTLPISDARRRIFDIAEEVQAPHKVYTLTAGGRPKVVMLSATEYESLIETVESLQQFPDLDARIEEARHGLASGAYKKWPVLADIKNGVHRRSASARSKRHR